MSVSNPDGCSLRPFTKIIIGYKNPEQGCPDRPSVILSGHPCYSLIFDLHFSLRFFFAAFLSADFGLKITRIRMIVNVESEACLRLECK